MALKSCCMYVCHSVQLCRARLLIGCAARRTRAPALGGLCVLLLGASMPLEFSTGASRGAVQRAGLDASEERCVCAVRACAVLEMDPVEDALVRGRNWI